MLNPVRRQDLRRAHALGDLEPLPEFITRTRPPTRSSDGLNVAYAQAWALFRMLFEHRRPALIRYMRSLNDAPRGWRSSVTLHREFEQAFGPAEDLQRQWRRHLDALCAEAP